MKMRNNSSEALQHELADRVFVLSQSYSEFISNHKFLSHRPELKKQAKEIEKKLGEFYQAIWNLGDNDNEPRPKPWD